MTTKILGISAYYHDSAAALVIDGHIVAAAQEERFTRKKHDPSFPTHAINYCLETAQCDIRELDVIIFYDKPLLKFERLLETYLGNAPRGIASFIRAMPVWLKEKLYLKSVLRREIRQLGRLDKKETLPKLLFSEHHLSHAGSAFFPSPFEESAVLCLDGVGEWATSTAWHGKNDRLKPLWEIDFPHSLGLLYSAFTYYAGFRVNSGEYKLMGLAPYGEPRFVETIYQHLVSVKDDGSFALNMDYFDFATGSTMTNKKFDQLFGGPPRAPDAETGQKEMDLARSVQVVTEEIILKIVNHLSTKCDSKNLCMAGGVALNCVANGRILRESEFENIWIQPAAGDAGGALGAALVAWHHYFDGKKTTEKQENQNSRDKMQGTFLGPAFSDDEVKEFLSSNNVPYAELPAGQRTKKTVELIEQGKVVGWFQGRMEFGPRALGNRSIIGDPRNTEMQTTMNLKIKQRESFRPFAPAVLDDKVSNYFDTTMHRDAISDYTSPYMLLVGQVRDTLLLSTDKSLSGLDKLKQKRSTLPAITHVDNSARIQTVHQKTNPEFYELIKGFGEKTGCFALINTSFNVRGEPPVCTPADAVRCFLASDMDYLVLGNIMLDKRQQSVAAIDDAKAVTFELD